MILPLETVFIWNFCSNSTKVGSKMSKVEQCNLSTVDYFLNYLISDFMTSLHIQHTFFLYPINVQQKCLFHRLQQIVVKPATYYCEESYICRWGQISDSLRCFAREQGIVFFSTGPIEVINYCIWRIFTFKRAMCAVLVQRIIKRNKNNKN